VTSALPTTIASQLVATHLIGLPVALQNEWKAACESALATGFGAWPEFASESVANLVAQAIWRTNATSLVPLVDVGKLHIADLTLAQACFDGNSSAVGTFVEIYTQRIGEALSRQRIPQSAMLDLRQDIFSRLLVFEPRKIGSYTGRAQLRTWLRVVATREALMTLRKVGDVAVDDNVLQAIQNREAANLDNNYVAKRYAKEFRVAFASAIQSLDPKDRTLLRQYYVDALKLEEMATMYRTSKSTMSRRMDAVRESLGKRVVVAFRELVPANAAEMQSIIRGLQSQISLSLSRLTNELC
jgi:RNA polymerase sigma-70 factor, ECF subfamily